MCNYRYMYDHTNNDKVVEDANTNTTTLQNDNVNRKDKIAALFSDLSYYKNEKDREEAIIAFDKTNLTIEEIESIVDSLKNATLSAGCANKQGAKAHTGLGVY